MQRYTKNEQAVPGKDATAHLRDEAIRLNNLGQGWEADIFEINRGRALEGASATECTVII